MGKLTRQPSFSAIDFLDQEINTNKNLEIKAKKKGRPPKYLNSNRPSAERNLPQNETRKTFIVNKEHLTILENIAYTKRTTIKQELYNALDKYIKAEIKQLEKNNIDLLEKKGGQ